MSIFPDSCIGYKAIQRDKLRASTVEVISEQAVIYRMLQLHSRIVCVNAEVLQDQKADKEIFISQFIAHDGKFDVEQRHAPGLKLEYQERDLEKDNFRESPDS